MVRTAVSEFPVVGCVFVVCVWLMIVNVVLWGGVWYNVRFFCGLIFLWVCGIMW